jgi:hypothetical protein
MVGRDGLTVAIVIAPEADHDEAFFLGEDGLVNMPGRSKVRQYDRTHGGVVNGNQQGATWRKLESSELIAGRPRDRLGSCDCHLFGLGLRQHGSQWRKNVEVYELESLAIGSVWIFQHLMVGFFIPGHRVGRARAF